MRNYMFDQWEASAAPAAAGRQERPGHRRRGVVVMALFLVCIAGLTALTMVLERLSAQRSGGSADSGGNYDTVDPGFGVLPGLFDTEEDQEAVTTIPRAQVGSGTLMSIVQERGGAPLDGQEIYKKVLPSVVSINAFSSTMGSSGSGVVMSEDGYILTNYHVIEGSREAWVTPLDTGERYRAELVGYYAELDIAVLKIDAEGLTPAEFGSSRALEVGEEVYAIGNPMGYLYGSMTNGIVSAVNRPVTIGGNRMTLIQTNAALNSGNSGGALVNAWGQVVGITVAKIDPPSEVTTEGLGLAVPISEVRRCVNSLLRTGEMENPAIGITCRAWAEGDGVLVVSVNEGGPAEAAGLAPNDVITEAGGVPVADVEELKDVIYDLGIGAQLHCVVLRDGETLKLDFTLGELEA